MPTPQDYYAYLRSQAASPATFQKSTHTAGSSDPNAFNPGQFIIDVLSTGGYATAGIAKKFGENISSIQKGDLGGLADALNPLSILGGAGTGIATRQTYSPLLQNLGVDKNVSPWLGLALDIGLDPTTYLTLGSVGAVKGVAGGVRLASLANKTGGKIAAKGTLTGKVAERAGDLIVPTGRDLTQSEKLANLLTGVSRGYSGKKAEIRLTQFGSKLERKTAKQIAKSGDSVLENVEFKPMIGRGASGAANDAAYRGLLTESNAIRGIIEDSRRLSRISAKAGKASQKLVDKGIVDPKAVVKAERKAKKALAEAGATAAAAEAAIGAEKIVSDGVTSTPVKSEFSEQIERTVETNLANLTKAEKALKPLTAMMAKLNVAARSIADTRVTGGRNYIADLRPVMYDKNDPSSPINLIPGATPSGSGFKAVGKNKNPKYNDKGLGTKVYPTEEEAIVAAKEKIEEKLASALPKLRAEVYARIDEIVAYEDGLAIAEALSKFDGITKEEILDSVVRAIGLSDVPPSLKDLEVYDAIKDVVVKLPTDSSYDGFRIALNQLNRDRLQVNRAGTYTRDELQAWADFVNSLTGVKTQIENNRKGIKSVDWFENGEYNPYNIITSTTPIEPEDFYRIGNLVTEMSLAEKTKALRGRYDDKGASAGRPSMSGEVAKVNPAAVEDVVDEKLKAKEVSLFTQQVEALPKAKKAAFEKLQKEVAETRKNLRTLKQKGYDIGLRRNYDAEDALPTKSEYNEVVKYYEDEIVRITDEMVKIVPAVRQELEPMLKPGTGKRVEVTRDLDVETVPTGTNRKKLEQSMDSAKANNATLRDIIMVTSYTDENINKAISKVLDNTLTAIPKKFSDVKPLKKASLLGRIAPTSGEKNNAVFTAFRKYLDEQLGSDRADIFAGVEDDPEMLKEAFEEFLSGRNIQTATGASGAVDLEKLNNPDMTTYSGLDDLIGALQKNQAELTYDENTKLLNALGVSDDPTSISGSDLGKKLITFTKKFTTAQNNAIKAGVIFDSTEIQLRNFIETGGSAATTDNAIGAAGVPASPEIAVAVETATQATEEVTRIVDDAMDETVTAADDTELIARQGEIQARAAEDFAADLNELDTFGSSRSFVSQMINNVFLKVSERKGVEASGVVAKIQKIAAARNMTPEELINKMITDEEFAVRENIEDFFTGLDIRLDGLNTEARFNLFNDAANQRRKLSGVSTSASKEKKGKPLREGATPETLLREETLMISAAENFFRSIGISVTASENYGEVLLRHGITKTDEALPEGATELKSFVTYSDIVKTVSENGQAALINRLRYPTAAKGGRVQNVMPSQFEKAWLVILDALSKDRKIVSGDETWLRAKEAFNTVYSPSRAEGVKSQPVSDLFKPAPHMVGSKVKVANKTVDFRASADVAAAVDEMIDALVKNGEDLLAVHAGRAATTFGPHSLEVIKRSRTVYSALAKLAIMREKLITNSAELAARGEVPTEAGYREALAVGDESIPGFDRLVEELVPILEELKKAKLVEGDIASNLFDTLMGTTLKVVSQKMRVASGKHVATTLVQEAREAAERILRFDEVYPAAKKPNPKKVKEETAKIRKEAQKKTASKAQETARAVEEAEPVREADIAKQEQALAAGEKPAFEKSQSSTNLVAGHEDPYIAALEMTANGMFKFRIDDWWMEKFSGTFGVGKQLKTALTGVEHLDINLVGRFNRGLQKVATAYGNDMPSINKAFSLMQRWGAEMRELDLEGEVLTSFDEWLKTADTTGVNMDIVNSLRPWHERLFGSLDGKSVGVMSKAIEQATFRQELNKFIGRQGLSSVNKNNDGFILRKVVEDSGENAHPLDVRWSWTTVDVEDMDDLTALDFLSRYSTALLMTHTRVASVETFTYFFGRNLKQLREEGLNPSDFYKPDPAEIKGIGHLIPEDIYFEKHEFEKLVWLNKYLDADSGFGSSSLQRLVDISDRITHVLKASHTLWRPGHHVTSIVGETFINMIHGVHSPLFYSKAWSIMRTYSPGSVDDQEDFFRAMAELGAGKGMVIDANAADNYFYIGTDGKKRVVNQKAIWAAMERYGVATNPFQSKEDFIKTDGTGFGTGLFKGISRQNDKLATFSAHRDNIFRISHFIKELERGGAYDSLELAALAAARKVHEAHPTVGSLSAFEKKYMRRVVFFYTWQRLMATHIASLMLQKPGIVTVPSKIQYAFAESAGFNPESFGNPWDPDGVYASYNTGSVYGPQFAGPQGRSDAWGVQPAVPQLDIMNTLFQGFSIKPNQSPIQGIGDGLLNLATKNFSPIPKLFAEISTQQKVGTTGSPIAPQDNYLPYLLDQIGGVSTLSQITGIGRDPVTNKTQENFDEERMRKIANWLTGQKLTDYSTPASQKQWTQDQRDTITRLIKQQNPTESTVKY
jgi:hypothetical protein